MYNSYITHEKIRYYMKYKQIGRWEDESSYCSRHGGFEYKEAIKKLLEEMNIQYKDFGTHKGESVDYPDYAKPVSEM